MSIGGYQHLDVLVAVLGSRIGREPEGMRIYLLITAAILSDIMSAT